MERYEALEAENARLRELEATLSQDGEAGAYARLWRKSSRERDEARRQLRGAVEGVVAWLREQATGERSENPASGEIELIADFIEREHPNLGGGS